MAMHNRSKRLPEIYGKFQFDPRFRHACTEIARAISCMSEQDARDALLMAEKLNYWNSLSETGASVLFGQDIAERDAVLRGVQ